MAYHSFHLLVIILISSYLISSNSIPMPRLSNLQKESKDIMASKSLNQKLMTPEDDMDDDLTEGRMNFEKNDYGPATSNPVHTPKPPLT